MEIRTLISLIVKGCSQPKNHQPFVNEGLRVWANCSPSQEGYDFLINRNPSCSFFQHFARIYLYTVLPSLPVITHTNLPRPSFPLTRTIPLSLSLPVNIRRSLALRLHRCHLIYSSSPLSSLVPATIVISHALSSFCLSHDHYC